MKHILTDGAKRILFMMSFAILCGVCLDLAGCFNLPKCIPVDWKALGVGERIVWDVPDNACTFGNISHIDGWDNVVRQNFRIINERLDKCPCAAGGIMFGRQPAIQEESIP